MIAQLAVAAAVYAIDKPYSYRVPEGMQVQPGLRVLVPFGRGNRRSEAVVLALQDTVQRDLKVIERALDDAPILSQAQLQLAAFMKERYFCTFYEAVKAILPAGFWFEEKKTLTLAPGAQDKLPPGMANSDAARLVQLLQEFGGSAPERTLRQQFSSPQVFDTAVQQLLRRKLLRSDAELTQKTGGKTVKIAALAVSAEEAEQFAAKKQTSAPLQAAVLRLLCAIGAGPCREICALTGASMQTVTRLCKLGLLEQQEREVLRSPKQELPPPAEPITLTDEQQTAFDGLSAQMEREKPGAAIIAGFQRVEGIDAGLREIHGLDRRRGGAEQDERARLGPAVKGDLPRVIARGVFGFIGVLLLLIEDEKPGLLQRRKDRRARADHDSGLAPGDAPPLVVAFADAQARVEHGDGLAEVRGHAAEQLRGQGDLRHQEHGGAALVQRFLDERDVDGGLAAAGHAVEQGRAGLFALHLGG